MRQTESLRSTFETHKPEIGRSLPNCGPISTLDRYLAMETHSTQPAVLVVEDEWIIRLHARTVVEDAGFCVVEAADADEALKVFEANPNIKALFTDINMPGKLDGLELAHEVHARRPDVRLIITSGRVRPSRDRIPDDGIFLSKPYSEEAVVRSLAGLLH